MQLLSNLTSAATTRLLGLAPETLRPLQNNSSTLVAALDPWMTGQGTNADLGSAVSNAVHSAAESVGKQEGKARRSLMHRYLPFLHLESPKQATELASHVMAR
jgi:hypothetical protein